MVTDFPVALSEPSLLITNGLVAGEFRPSRDRNEFEVFEPSTGNVLMTCTSMGRADFTEAIESANIGFERFSTSTTAKARGEILRRWYELILKHKDDCMFTPPLQIDRQSR